MNAIAPATEIPSTVLTAADLAELQRLESGVALVDVRTPTELESIHIPGSYNVPLDQIAARRAEFASFGGPIVLVCRTGLRARQAETLLREADVPRLHILDGGVSAWEQAGLAVVRGRQSWSIERQVRAIAGGLVLRGRFRSTTWSCRSGCRRILPYDLLFVVPPHRPAQVLLDSGLAGPNGVKIDPYTLTTECGNVWGIGDAADSRAARPAWSPTSRPTWWPTTSPSG